MKFTRLFAAVAVLMCSSIGVATPITADALYELGNHPDGGAANPLYGLRLDGLLTGDSSDIYTFDFEASGVSMSMLWSSGTDELRIWGTAFGGQDIGSDYLAGTTALWTINFTYTGISACGTGICSSSGGRTVSSDLFGSFDLVPTGSNTYGYAFQVNDGHRGVAGPSGWGWMNHCASAGNTIEGGSCIQHLYASDWLFTVHSVPEPGTLVLFGIGLLGIGMLRRRKTV